ncbi:hypothetical protein [Actinoplanes sp. HUAS TT8]|uniref:hypothetical protein n=1 Tax=Actinoplanes sp. HUAS TT8 TaxID=3447453 RepID=UPI003F5234B6
MSTALDMIQNGAFAAGAGAVLYSSTVTAAAITALVSRSADRRRDARTVLTILLRARNDAGRR